MLVQIAVGLPRFTASARAIARSVSRSLAAEVMRAFMMVSRSDGAAMTASMAITATTIINSIIVKPAGREIICAPWYSMCAHCGGLSGGAPAASDRRTEIGNERDPSEEAARRAVTKRTNNPARNAITCAGWERRDYRAFSKCRHARSLTPTWPLARFAALPEQRPALLPHPHPLSRAERGAFSAPRNIGRRGERSVGNGLSTI